MKRNEKNDAEYEDDNRTIADMNVEGLPWYNKNVKNKNIQNNIKLTTKEKFRVIFYSLKIIVPIALGFVAVYFLIFLLLDIFWLK